MSECSQIIEVPTAEGDVTLTVPTVCGPDTVEVDSIGGETIVEVDSRSMLPGPPGPPGEGFPTLTNIADLDTITETSVVLLDDIDGIAAEIFGAGPGLLDEGPVLVTTFSLLGGQQRFQVMQLSIGEYERLITPAATRPWRSFRAAVPTGPRQAMLSYDAGGSAAWNIASAASDPDGVFMLRYAGGRSQVNTPVDPLDIANKAYVDAASGATTGWRDCTNTDIVTGGGSTVVPATGRYLLLRDGNLVHMQLESLAPTSAASAWPRIPSGFWPRGGSNITVAIWDDTTGDQILMRSGGNQWTNVLGGRPLAAGSPRSATLSWRTSQIFPSTLPGVPA